MKDETKIILNELHNLRSDFRQDINKVHDKIDMINSVQAKDSSEIKKDMAVIKTRIAVFTVCISFIVTNFSKILSYLKN